jgi:hypothetical protein
MTTKHLAFAVLALLGNAAAALFVGSRHGDVELQCSDAVIAAATSTTLEANERELATKQLKHPPGPHAIAVRAANEARPSEQVLVEKLYFDGNVHCATDVFDQRGRIARRDRFDKAHGMVRTFYNESGQEVRSQIIDEAGHIVNREPIFVPAQPVRIGYP